MRKSLPLFALVLALSAASFVSAAEFSLPSLTFEALRPKTAPWNLRVLTYNVHGISPWFVGPQSPDTKALGRYREIARRLRALRAQGKAPHLVTIQEAWHPLSARTAKEAGYPYLVEGAGARFGKVGGSGLYVLSEYPVVASETIDYKECTGYDCAANKGALHVRVVVPELGRLVDFYTTHMNADEAPATPEDSLKARIAQILQFAAFVRRTRDQGSVAVLAGDFNFKGPAQDFALFKSLTGAANAEEQCLASRCTGADPGPILRDSVDHLFQLGSPRSVLKPTHLALTFTEPHEGKPLSDHVGVEAHYLLTKVNVN